MKHLIAVCAVPRLAATVAGIVRSEHSVVVVVDRGQLTAGVRPVHRIVDASDHAFARGVRPGQTISEAQRYAPDLQVKIVGEDQLRAEVTALAEVLLTVSPSVEPILPRDKVALPCFAIAVDVTGLPRSPTRLLSDLARAVASASHTAMVAVSSSKLLSMAVAKDMAHRPALYRRRTMVEVPIGAVDHLVLDVLDLDTDLVATLNATGVRTVGDLRPLLAQGLVTRLGTQTKAVLPLLVEGDVDADSDGVVPWRPTEIVGATRELEHAVTAVEPLIFVLRPLVETIIRRLSGRAEKLVELVVMLGRRRREPAVLNVVFPDATNDIAVIVRVLSARVDAFFTAHHEHVDRSEDHLLAVGIDRLTLVARRTVPAKARQLGLLNSDDDRLPEAVVHLLAELTAEHGTSRVGVLTTTRSPLPEEMSQLGWPPPPPLDQHSDVPRRRRLRPAVTDRRTREGRFTAGWPWPLRLLPHPRPLDDTLLNDIVTNICFALLEGTDLRGTWRRHYRLLTFTDGRRALALQDDEAGDTLLQGWFD